LAGACIERNIDKLRASMVEQKENVDKLLGALRDLIERTPPENLRQLARNSRWRARNRDADR
jgi:uncharacterized coiled-coil protein SlyX